MAGQELFGGNHGSWSTTGRSGPSVSGASMNNIIYIVGLIVVVLAILSFLGLR